MPHDHGDRSGEFSPEYCRPPECLPRSGTARRVRARGTDDVEADRVESFAVNTGPTKPHAFGTIDESSASSRLLPGTGAPPLSCTGCKGFRDLPTKRLKKCRQSIPRSSIMVNTAWAQ